MNWDFQQFFPKWLGDGSPGEIALTFIFNIFIWGSIVVSICLAAWAGINYHRDRLLDDERDKVAALKKHKRKFMGLGISIFLPIGIFILFNIVDAILGASGQFTRASLEMYSTIRLA